MKRTILACFLLFPTVQLGRRAPETIPPGTILPVQLNTSLSSAKAKPGDKITARIMQNVPLPNGSKIGERTRVLGHVVSVTPAAGATPGTMTIEFDSIEAGKQTIPVAANLRAIASTMEVDEAQDPKVGADRGTPSEAFNTIQVGGDAVYRGGGHVFEGSQIVGDPVPGGGVLVTVSSRPDTPCRGDVAGNTARQAMWVFSADACGVYGFSNLEIAHAGRNEPLGQIVLTAKSGELKVGSGTGMLLRVNARS
jgi:hypothetical protein